ncbi:GNAT family N-acetyltransferase [Nannocystis sp. SCPEA4]|uniref:GNAT family N-acetyltransferase n=1 Tax=Nannocystis sp. SCPEA4 TaxID=2996787 RepID=UPI00226DA89A|nr:GNAT family N-acetyltransferase [Nannocystis sp. SCPEA4]MCY1058221.1 GNAT family N-acetyltransferase [Nannocystis sp. SCPEA4]
MRRLAASIEPMLQALPLPDGIVFRGLARADLPAVLAALSEWHPDIAIGEERRLITAAFYEEHASFVGEDDDLEARPVRVALLREGEELVGILVLEYDAAEHALIGLLSAVSPRKRGCGLGRALIRADEILARAAGAHVVYGFVELDNLPQGASLEREGRRLYAIIPDCDVRRFAGGATKYVPEGVFLKVLLPPEELLWPDPADLLPRTAALFGMVESLEAAASVQFGACPPPALPPIDLSVAARPMDTWPDVAVLAREVDLPPGCSVLQLRREDIPRVISMFRASCCDVAAELTSASFYEEVALAGEEQRIAERPWHVFTVERDGELVGVPYSFYDSQAHTLRIGPGDIDPQDRSQRCGAQLIRLSVLLARAIGAEAVVTRATLRHRRAQIAAERAGLCLWGLIPASERVLVGPGVIKRGFEAFYGVSLVPPEQSRWPTPVSLPPHRAAWARFVRGEASERTS